MRSAALALLVLGTLTFQSVAQSDVRPTSSLKASIQGEELIGEWELSSLSGSADENEVLSAADTAKVSITRGSSFQIQVKILDPAGSVQDVTGSPNLMYLPKGCLVVQADGKATVPQSIAAPWSCDSGEPVPLTIIYSDGASGAAAVNMYLFKLR